MCKLTQYLILLINLVCTKGTFLFTHSKHKKATNYSEKKNQTPKQMYVFFLLTSPAALPCRLDFISACSSGTELATRDLIFQTCLKLNTWTFPLASVELLIPKAEHMHKSLSSYTCAKTNTRCLCGFASSRWCFQWRRKIMVNHFGWKFSIGVAHLRPELELDNILFTEYRNLFI